MIGLWVLLLGCLRLSAGLANGLARTPPMGWSSWNAFHDDIDEQMVKETADALVSTGLAQAGFVFISLDDGWADRVRPPKGPIKANTTRFPSGIKALSDYVHDKGLKLGIYSDSGSQTCAGYAASLNHEKEDAEAFADWGVDLLKLDNCFTVPPAEVSVRKRYEAMRDGLNASGRPILFSMCEWGVSSPWLYGHEVGNTWRTTKDISLGIEATWEGVLENLDETVGLARFAGPGGWNDADMLEIGEPGGAKLSYVEQRSHFALWAILKSPLIFGADLRKLKQESLLLLKSTEVIAINQDPLGVAGDLVWKQGPLEVYAAPLVGGARAVVLFNRHLASDDLFPDTNMTVHWEQIGLPANLKVTVRDLFLQRDIAKARGQYSAIVDSHGVAVLKLTPIKPGPLNLDAWRPWSCDAAAGDICRAAHGRHASAGALEAATEATAQQSAPNPCPRHCYEGLESLLAGHEAERRNTVMALLLGVGSGFVLGFLAALVTLHMFLARAGNGWGGAGGGGSPGLGSVGEYSSLPCSPSRSAYIPNSQAASPSGLDAFSTHVRKSIRAAQKLDKF